MGTTVVGQRMCHAVANMSLNSGNIILTTRQLSAHKTEPFDKTRAVVRYNRQVLCRYSVNMCPLYM